jgi:AcrR family transcriptional regulator
VFRECHPPARRTEHTRDNARQVADDEDLTTYARIRNAALELFATRGATRTTIREVAGAAGVSPGLVQHHFGTKAGLREAVDRFVLEDAQGVLTDLPEEPDQRSAQFGARMAAIARERPAGILYFARLVSEGDEVGLRMFEALVGAGVPELREMEKQGQLAPGLDLEWAAMHVVMFNLASFLFEPAITRTLGEPLVSEDGLARWNAAATQLLTRAIVR